jgi:hypothetical protein
MSCVFGSNTIWSLLQCWSLASRPLNCWPSASERWIGQFSCEAARNQFYSSAKNSRRRWRKTKAGQTPLTGTPLGVHLQQGAHLQGILRAACIEVSNCIFGDTVQKSFYCPGSDAMQKVGLFRSFWNLLGGPRWDQGGFRSAPGAS